MHPADKIAVEYGRLVRERDDIDKKIMDVTEPLGKRREEIEKRIAELREQAGAALADPDGFAAKSKKD